MDGAIVIDKPAGITSHDVIARVRKIVGERRVGHTGTLDPFATGVLVVLVGRATRLAQFLSGAEKEYETVIRLGFATDTGDATGNPVREFVAEAQTITELRREEIETAMASLRGEIEQTPPMYSAKKIAGRRLYEYARRGEEVDRAPIHVNIKTFELLSNDCFLDDNENIPSDVRARVVCSAGTYVRTLAEDLGRKLGVGAHLAGLRRTRAGNFRIEDAITLDKLSKWAETESTASVSISPNDALCHLPSMQLPVDDAIRAGHGIELPVSSDSVTTWSDGQAVRLCRENDLIAVARYDASRQAAHPFVVLASVE